MTSQRDPLAGLPEVARALIVQNAMIDHRHPLGFNHLLDAVVQAPDTTAADVGDLVNAWLRGELPTMDQPMKVDQGFAETVKSRRFAPGWRMPHEALTKELEVLDALPSEVLESGGELPHDEAMLIANLLSDTTMSPEDAATRLRRRRLAETLREEAEHEYFDVKVANRLIERIEGQPPMYDYALERAVLSWLSQDEASAAGPLAVLNT